MSQHQLNGRSTGPRTAEGKANSCLNHTKHGLTGRFRVLAAECQAAFDELRDALRAEHQPSTPTEFLLVDRMAEHVWQSQRAQRLVDSSLTNTNETWIALMLRYQTTHDRAFHKCLAELRTMRRESRNAAQSQAHATPPSQQEVPTRSAAAEHFESQNIAAPPSTPQFESQKPASPASESLFKAASWNGKTLKFVSNG